MILIIDCETTGIPNFNERARHPSQPHIVSFTALLCHDDGTVDEEYDLLVRPEGWTIPKEASDVHGITNAIAATHTVREHTVAEVAVDLMRRADLLVAHSLQFDKFLCRIAARRYDVITDADDLWWKQYPSFCTMRATTDICQLPGGRGGQFKWPKLSEAYRHIFGKNFDRAHTSLADCHAAKEIFFWLRSEGKA